MIEPTTEAGRSELSEWLRSHGELLRGVTALTGDVSPRRYFRLALAGGGTAVLATYPPDIRPVCERFMRTTELLGAAGVRVPRVLAADCARGAMLLEDLGPQTLADRKGRPWSELGRSFAEALRQARAIAALPAASVCELDNPRLGSELLRSELDKTWRVFVEPRRLAADPALAADLGAALDELCLRLAADPPAVCHRDFMARNLIPLDDDDPQDAGEGSLAVLDHQDLRLGPPAYDLASLLNDTLFPPPEAEEALLAAACDRAGGAAGDHRLRYHRAAAQRTLKAVGTYAAFALRGADRHLPLVTPTLERFFDHFARTPEGAELAAPLARAWRPALVAA